MCYCICQFSLTGHPQLPPHMDWAQTSSFCFLLVWQKALHKKQTAVKLLIMPFLHAFYCHKVYCSCHIFQMYLTCDLQLGLHGSSITLQALLPHQKDLQQRQIVKSHVNIGLPLQGTNPNIVLKLKIVIMLLQLM